MRFFAIASFLASGAAAMPALAIPAAPTPDPQDVKILSITAIGTGCPAGTASVTLDATGTIFDVAFDQYTASVGPGNLPADARKNCRMSINLKFPAGFQ